MGGADGSAIRARARALAAGVVVAGGGFKARLKALADASPARI